MVAIFGYPFWLSGNTKPVKLFNNIFNYFELFNDYVSFLFPNYTHFKQGTISV